jgi:phosphatidylserine decarboxylase
MLNLNQNNNESLLPWYARPLSDLQYLIPHHWLSNILFHLSRLTSPWIKNFLIQQVISLYKIDMRQAQESDPTRYACFNEFFIRALHEDARPQDKANNTILAPVDGTLHQIGVLQNDKLLQAKRRDYSLLKLLGNDIEWTQRFIDGNFVTISLSLGDSHRVFMPLNGELIKMYHIPGSLFDINQFNLRLIPKLFLRNERVVCLFETAIGPMAVILIGTLFAGGIETTWAGAITPASRRINSWNYTTSTTPIRLNKGQQLGHFNMGSTVILLFGAKRIDLNSNLRVGMNVQMGISLGSILTGSIGTNHAN